MVKKSLKIIRACFIGVIIIVFIKTFFLEIYIIPSDSMAPTIQRGDIILVNKFAYELRMIWGDKTRRLFKVRPPVANDIVVFNFPEGDSIYAKHPEVNFYRHVRNTGRKHALRDTLFLGRLVRIELNDRQPFVKRLVAVPGDTFLIKDRDFAMFSEARRGSYDSLLNPGLVKERHFFKDIFPYDQRYRWSFMDFGPMVVPGKDRKMPLNSHTLPLYRKIIETYEENDLKQEGENIYINGKKSTSYKFRQDYYFMKGENKYDSFDSRFWGFVPENHVVGRAELIVFSIDLEKSGWDRIRTERCFKLLE